MNIVRKYVVNEIGSTSNACAHTKIINIICQYFYDDVHFVYETCDTRV